MAGKTNWALIAVLVVVGYVLYFGVPDFTGGSTTTDDNTDTTYCAIEDITFTPKMTRLGKAGTTLSGATENYYITTDSLGSTNGGSTVTVPTHYDLQVMYGEASTTYYTTVKKLNTGCEDPKYDAIQLAFADTALNSFYLQNADGTVNSGSVAQALGADDVFETTVTIKAGTDEYFGNPTSNCQNVGLVEYDKTYIKMVSGDNPTAVPGSFTYNNATFDGANAFYIPKVGDGSKAEFNIKIESTSSDPPASTPITLWLYDCDVDKNEDSLALIEGVEDEDLNALSLAKQGMNITLS